MKKLLAAVVAATSVLFACNSSTPCVDAECPAIAGDYQPTWDTSGGSLERQGDGGVCTWILPREWSLRQNGSAITLSTDLATLSGTLYNNGSMNLTGEGAGLSASLTAQVTPGENDLDAGTFTPAQLRGQLVANTFDAEGNSCFSTASFEATQR